MRYFKKGDKPITVTWTLTKDTGEAYPIDSNLCTLALRHGMSQIEIPSYTVSGTGENIVSWSISTATQDEMALGGYAVCLSTNSTSENIKEIIHNDAFFFSSSTSGNVLIVEQEETSGTLSLFSMLPAYQQITTGDFVKYTPQTLTTEQKAQARTNIGAGTYDKPSSGIPSSDMSSAVQTSLGKADSALQSHQQLKTINNQSLIGSGNITIAGGENVFVAYYSETASECTPFADIYAAFQAGKPCILVDIKDSPSQEYGNFLLSSYSEIEIPSVPTPTVQRTIGFTRSRHTMSSQCYLENINVNSNNVWQSISVEMVGYPNLGTSGQVLKKGFAAGAAEWGDVDYSNTINKPSINGVTLVSNKTSSDLGILPNPSGGTAGQVLKKTASGVEWANESGGGSSSYSDLTNKPSINGITLSGNKTSADLGINVPMDDSLITAYGTVSDDPSELTGGMEITTAELFLTWFECDGPIDDETSFDDFRSYFDHLGLNTNQLSNLNGYRHNLKLHSALRYGQFYINAATMYGALDENGRYEYDMETYIYVYDSDTLTNDHIIGVVYEANHPETTVYNGWSDNGVTRNYGEVIRYIEGQRCQFVPYNGISKIKAIVGLAVAQPQSIILYFGTTPATDSSGDSGTPILQLTGTHSDGYKSKSFVHGPDYISEIN